MSKSRDIRAPLTDQISVPSSVPDTVGEGAWIEVIQRMDDIYADLVRNQVQLEDKNEELKQANRDLRETHEALKTTQLQLIQAEKMASLGRLIAGVAHELNNPISFILGNGHAMERYSTRLQEFFAELRKFGDPRVEALWEQHRLSRLLDDLNPLVEGTNEGALRVSEIVSSLLRFTTPQHHSAATINLCQMLRTASEWVGRANQSKIDVHYDLPSEVCIENYEGPVHQILVNLIQNAVDAVGLMPEPQLWLSANERLSGALITIRDNGPGIATKDLVNIFDPFFTTKEAGKGTGLGLYISYLLATEHCGGSLEADNHANGGAEFRFSLPDKPTATEGDDHE